MKFYSEKTNMLYDSQEDLTAAEAKLENKASERKERAKEVEDAYKASIEARKQAQKLIDDADRKYLELRNKFIEDYKSFHMTYSSKEENPNTAISLDEFLDGLLNLFK